MSEPAPDDPHRERRLAAVRLTLTRGVGPLIARGLVDRCGCEEAVFRARPTDWQEVSGVGPKIVAALQETGTEQDAASELARCRRANAQVLIEADDDYPDPLRPLPDRPLALFRRGAMTAADRIAIGIVGSRTCTLYGRQTAERLGRELARAGVTVISGLARGIDEAAHRGALDAGGRTLAVIAGGLTKLYPPENRDLAREIVASGAVMTESPMDREPRGGLFPQRNRIISGLSCGVVVVEATRKSGSLHTARHAKEQDREVFAVPGRITDLTSEGTHDLLRDGATLVRGVDDILEALGPLPTPIEQPTGDGPPQTTLGPRELALSELERQVLGAIPQQPTVADTVVASLAGAGLQPSQVLAVIQLLEVRRFVQRHPGGFVQRVPA